MSEQPEAGREQIAELLAANPRLRRAALSGIPAAIKRELMLVGLGGRVDPRVLAATCALALGVAAGLPSDPQAFQSSKPIGF